MFFPHLRYLKKILREMVCNLKHSYNVIICFPLWLIAVQGMACWWVLSPSGTFVFLQHMKEFWDSQLLCKKKKQVYRTTEKYHIAATPEFYCISKLLISWITQATPFEDLPGIAQNFNSIQSPIFLPC